MSTVGLVAIGLAACVAALLVRGSPERVAARRLGSSRRTLRAQLAVHPLLVVVPAVAVASAVAFTTFGSRPNLLLVAVTGCAVAYAAVTLRRRTAARAVRHRRQAETVDICDAIVSELAAGSPSTRAIANVAADWSFLNPVAHCADLGGDVAQSLRNVASEPGRAALAQIAAAWEVSVRTGAGLADVLDRLSTAMRADDEARQEVVASLGAPRATARVLAVLPVFGLALGSGIGGDPLAVLLESMLGAICLAVGSALAISGLFWVERIADAAELV
ncbi:type II secretion system F family protein [Solicola gregarius]|uniref:Type II secretion system F family protein n=1 Tax=Solicola gregarius TaxID=2908642 RepID=A0AA46TDN8_9ACTN|nr:type II secretion system F family protein [Solicola gregarius]UYM03367.1 type II secretion system F family protein [Solicola gregarius]